MRRNSSSEGGHSGSRPPHTRRVLFVDDEPSVLDGLRRALHACNVGWDAAFVGGGAEALSLLQARPFDVIVSDLRMPEMDGGTLLENVRTSYPSIIRIALSGCAEREVALRASGIVHQYLAKPCQAAKIVECVERFYASTRILPDEAARRVVGTVGRLPSLPHAAAALMETLGSPDASLAEVNAIIASDVGMTAKVLQLVNSPLFSLVREITSIKSAVILIGLDALKELVFLAEVFSAFEPPYPIEGFSLTDFETHSALTARIASALPVPRSVLPGATTAGMLHDIGKLVLAVRLPEQLERCLALAREQNRSLFSVEFDLIGASHAEVGAYLLGLWGLSPLIVDAVCYHHRPGEAKCAAAGLSMAGLIHVANGLARELRSRTETSPGLLDLQYLVRAGVDGQLPEWRTVAKKLTPRSF